MTVSTTMPASVSQAIASVNHSNGIQCPISGNAYSASKSWP